ncbi:hypothetical protein N658DRAFT_459299 [Parathielavia hyrcaniae]|uniref:Uncharacterized protein n=1 Tax=Parathielavia hyrcaniae TaxID=113614 RepID=A0AAN6PQG4_9PEZI|nr:hypothetical protein N658DRAFT_459299 [Parathielavia hyrcaniae]
MATKPTVGHKRTRSLVLSESVGTKPTAPETAPQIRAVLIHFSALLSSNAAVTSTLRKALSGIISKREIPDMTDEAILRAFSTSPNLCNILRHLGVRELTDDERQDIESQYLLVYEMQGYKQLRLDSEVNSFLNAAARQPHLRLATLSNNPVLAADLVEQLGIGALEAVIPTNALNGMTEPSEAHNIFHSEVWNRLILPWFNDPVGGMNQDDASPEHDDSSKKIAPKPTTTTTPSTTSQTGSTANPAPNPTANNNSNPNNYHGPNPSAAPLHPSEVMVISCALYDLDTAKYTGTQTCWVRKTSAAAADDDDISLRAAEDYDIVASSWHEARLKLFGGSGKDGEAATGDAMVGGDSDDGGEGRQAKSRAVGVMESIAEEEDEEEGDDVVMQGTEEEQAKKQAVGVGMGDVDGTTEGSGGDENDAAVHAVVEDKEVVEMEICHD